ncbi:hypothetical protein BH11MYX3_BH11MYX3_16650 [soil metagenome]
MRPLVLVSLLVSSTALALPPGSDPVLKSGANHHIGDDSFVDAFGRPPTSHDAERVRMTTHLQHVRDWLASRPATRPELRAKRAAILAAFDVYIAKGTTPKNSNLPWRTPVFIDEEGTICAVGYLIESSAGRALPEAIAKRHRYDFIEAIAADRPEVATWVAESGFTLEEIGSIPPAYSEAEVDGWRSWDLAKYPPVDGPSKRYGSGSFKRGNMEGAWTMPAGDGVIGRGTMKRGRGAWTSFYPTGEKLAEGRYVANQPEGSWKMFHRSGNLAAEGEFSSGTRVGKWHFYYDMARRTPIAIGRFAGDGSVSGRWQHFDAEGKVLARSWTETPSQWQDDSYTVNGGEGSMLAIVPGADGVAHSVHQGTPGKDVDFSSFRLELYSKGRERLYIQHAFEHETWFGADGSKLEHVDGTWRGTSCHWSQTRKIIAQQGDVPRLDGVLSADAWLRARSATGREQWDAVEDKGPACSGDVEISAARARKLDVLLASRDEVRSASPAFVRKLVLDQEDDAMPSNQDEDPAERLATDDLTRVLSGHMAMYVEWPHIDRRFQQVYETMPGRYMKDWASRSDSDGDVNAREDQ